RRLVPSRVPRNGVSRQTTFQNRRKTGVYGRALVYPAVSDFPMMRAPFKLSDNLLLHFLPFEQRQAPYTFLAG
ncbi:hypothetical protein CN183_33025, partial [Sinorhizobium medicae]